MIQRKISPERSQSYYDQRSRECRQRRNEAKISHLTIPIAIVAFFTYPYTLCKSLYRNNVKMW